MQHKNTSQCKILTVPAGFASRNIVHLKKKSSVRFVTFCSIFFMLHVKPIRSLLIKRIPLVLSFRLLALKTFDNYFNNFSFQLTEDTHSGLVGLVAVVPVVQERNTVIVPAQIRGQLTEDWGVATLDHV